MLISKLYSAIYGFRLKKLQILIVPKNVEFCIDI